MTETNFADYVATQDARNTIELNVRKYCLMLCDCLLGRFKRQQSPDFDYKFYIESGRKYHKLIMETDGGSRSVHALLIRRRAMFSNQLHSKHLQRLFVTIFWDWVSWAMLWACRLGRRLSLCSLTLIDTSANFHQKMQYRITEIDIDFEE